jgi:hypothetical protein
LSPERCPATATAGRPCGLRVATAAVLLVAVAACSSPATSASPPGSRRSSTSSAGTVTTTPALGHPRGPSRVSVWGDSLSLQAHDALEAQGRAHGLNVAVSAFFGLATCDVARAMMRDIETVPDALVIAFTGNNISPCMRRHGNQLTGPAYYAAYRRDTDALVAAAVARKIPVIVLGAPAFPSRHNRPDRAELNVVLREVAAAHPGARYVASGPFVSPRGFTNTLPCLPGESAALGCDNGRIAVRSANGVHFDEPRTVPCPNRADVCRFTAGGRRFANAVLAGLAGVKGLSYAPAPPTAAVPVDLTRIGA